MRDRLVELIKHDNCINPATCSSKCKYVDLDDCHSERLADYLLANGVIVPSCNLGDILYVVFKELSDKVEEVRIVGIEMCRYDNQPNFVLFVYKAEVITGKQRGETITFVGSCFDRKEVCFSKEEAEAKLKGGER